MTLWHKITEGKITLRWTITFIWMALFLAFSRLLITQAMDFFLIWFTNPTFITVTPHPIIDPANIVNAEEWVYISTELLNLARILTVVLAGFGLFGGIGEAIWSLATEKDNRREMFGRYDGSLEKPYWDYKDFWDILIQEYRQCR